MARNMMSDMMSDTMSDTMGDTASEMTADRKGRGRGFASMNPEKQREIASKGGRAAHSQGTAHEWTSDEARMAGRKGGASSRAQATVD